MSARTFQPSDDPTQSISEALAAAGVPNVVVTDIDRLAGALIEAEIALAYGHGLEAKRILRTALKEQ